MNIMRALLLAASVAACLTSAPALADGPRGGRSQQDGRAQQLDRNGPVREQERAFEATRQGRSMPLPQIERRVMPLMPGADYLGPEINGGTYRMKFIQNGRVIWVDVDPQTGRIIRRSRP
jgi:hypothetical protein